MKKLLCLLLLSGITAQTFGQGIFNQKGEMIKKSIRQIALLACYGRYVRKGYTIMQDGWNTIHSWKDGEFNLHTAYYKSLAKVNPKVKGEQVNAIQDLALSLLEGASKLRQATLHSEVLNDEETTYLQSTLNGYIHETTENISELNLVITDDKLSMTDDERISQMDRLYNRMVKLFQLFKQLENNTRTIITGRTENRLHRQELRQWLNIPGQP